MMIMEQVMSRVAARVGLPAEVVREKNMYNEGDITPYDMVLDNCTIRKCWAQLKHAASFEKRKHLVESFNE